ncbi:MAG: adenylate/guanylate cyclase domain-containing protein, partial [Gemmatimonas sp.]
ELRIARDAHGADAERSVPRAIVNGVAERQVALLTHDAREDTRTAGESVVRQAVRSAMAAPLLGEGQVTIGVAYVDNVRSASAFADDDLHFLVAFAGIAAAAVEREASASQLRHAAHVRENFERYFSPQLAERIAATSGSITLGGTRQHVVVLFSDIRGFTAIAESLPPIEMANQLNEYFGVMVECVFAHGGALDKFIGDSLLAYWGAPLARDDDAPRALAAAQAMGAALKTLNARWRAEGRPELHAGVAIHCGEAFLGNIGSPRRLEYTLIGDTVNLTSKLCGRARGGEILITDAMRVALGGSASLLARADVVPERRAGNAMGVWEVRQ